MSQKQFYIQIFLKIENIRRKPTNKEQKTKNLQANWLIPLALVSTETPKQKQLRIQQHLLGEIQSSKPRENF